MDIKEYLKNSNKINKFLLVTTILSMTILLIGGTFSYFTLSTMSKMDVLAVSAGKVRLGLGVSPVYTGYPIIPLKDEYISVAYKQKCKDDLDRGACLAYGLEVFNFEEKSENMSEWSNISILSAAAIWKESATTKPCF